MEEKAGKDRSHWTGKGLIPVGARVLTKKTNSLGVLPRSKGQKGGSRKFWWVAGNGPKGGLTRGKKKHQEHQSFTGKSAEGNKAEKALTFIVGSQTSARRGSALGPIKRNMGGRR